MSLPTFQLLGTIPPSNIDALIVAQEWVSRFSIAISELDIPAILPLFIEDGWWRDLLSLTWDYRSFHGPGEIGQFLKDRLSLSQLSNIKLSILPPPSLMTPYPDLGWIQVFLKFETAVGFASAVLRLVYVPCGEWKAFTLFTFLEDLKCDKPQIDTNYPERSDYAKQREREELFLDTDPAVIIIGGGQSGLGLAARLRALGVSSLIIEQLDRVGDQWRKARYSSLRLHDPVWRDHLPLFPFPEPPLWPVYMPGVKLADFMEAYAKHLDLNVWTSSTAREPKWDAGSKTWTVTVVTKGKERTMKARHLIWAVGLNSKIALMPTVPGMDEFKGDIIHSSRYLSPEPYLGKKVIVLGSGVSGHDICMDLASQGTDVTMIQRSPTYIMSTKNGTPALYKPLYWKGGPPTELADVLSNSLPNKIVLHMAARMAAKIAEMDEDLLDGLKRAGFRTDMGPENAGTFRSATKRGGGWYINVGASDMIIDGQIKVKSGTPMQRFTLNSIIFEDGTELEADAVICATGYGKPVWGIAEAFGEDFTMGLKEIWDWDEEFEMNSVWRDSGKEAFYVVTNNLPGSRFWSRFLALQIKAIEAGIMGTKYSRS